MESHHAPCGDRNFLSGFRIASGALRFVTQLEIAEPRELYAVTAFKRVPDLFEEGFDHILGLTFVEADFFKQQISEFCFGKRHVFSLSDAKLCRECLLQIRHQLLHCGIDFRILQSFLSILHNYTKCKTFFPGGDAFSGVNIEQSNVLNDGRPMCRHAIHERLQFELLINHDGQIADRRRVAVKSRCIAVMRTVSGHRDRARIPPVPVARSYFCSHCGCSSPTKPMTLPSTLTLRAATRMQGRMNDLLEAGNARRQQRFDFALDVEEIDVARSASPLFGEGTAVSQSRRFSTADGNLRPGCRVVSRKKQRPVSNTRTRLCLRFRLVTTLATSPPISVERITLIWLAIGLARRIGAVLAAKSDSQASSTKAKLITS